MLLPLLLLLLLLQVPRAVTTVTHLPARQRPHRLS
jgi:hypothetical protein